MLFTSSLGPSWNDLPLTPLYLPFIHQMVRYAGAREENSWYGLGQTFTVAKDRGAPPPAVDTPVYRRVGLGAGDRLDGPAIVEERETTAVIRPGWTASVAADGSLVATRERTTDRGGE